MKKNKIKNGVLSVLTLTAIVAVFVIIEKTSTTSGYKLPLQNVEVQDVEEFGDRNPEPIKIQTTDIQTRETEKNLQSTSLDPVLEETKEVEKNNPTYSESEYERAEKYVSKNWLPDNTIDKEAYIAVGGTHMNYWNKPINQLPTNLVDEDKENNSDQSLLD